MNREYASLNALYRGETIEVEGFRVHWIDGVIKVGDMYVAERNTGPKLMIAREIDTSDGGCGWIVPLCLGYCYDTHECVKVEEML